MPAFRVTFGEVDASELVANVQTTRSVNDLARAEIWINDPSTLAEPLDLFAEVKVQGVLDDGTTHDLFTGEVISAVTEATTFHLSLLSGSSLLETNPSPRWTHGVSTPEQIYTILREAGFPHEKTDIQGVDQIAAESMLVVVPIEDVVVDAALTVFDITLVPGGGAVEPYANRGVADLVYQPLIATPVHAVYSTTVSLLRDAEEEGLRAVDVALAYLQMTLSYGLIPRPDGTPQPFVRTRARGRPRRGEVVAVEALSSGRCWVRVPEDRTPPVPTTLDQTNVMPLGHVPTGTEQQALIAWRRAASEKDPIARATALSDAMEFYAAGVTAPELFNETELEDLLAAIPDIEPHKLAVVRGAIKRLNDAPLKRRLIEAAARDGVPLTHAEVDFLWKRIRRARNKAVHGDAAQPPTQREIERALSLVGRLLTYQLAKPVVRR
jgi:hypothetical protein